MPELSSDSPQADLHQAEPCNCQKCQGFIRSCPSRHTKIRVRKPSKDRQYFGAFYRLCVKRLT